MMQLLSHLALIVIPLAEARSIHRLGVSIIVVIQFKSAVMFRKMSRDSFVYVYNRPLYVLWSLTKMEETPNELALTFQLQILVRPCPTETASHTEAQMRALSETPSSY
jgi:hypothetical protein